MDDTLRNKIEQSVRKQLWPGPFMRWTEGLTNAERVGRIKRSKWSTLRYSLRQYIRSQLPRDADSDQWRLLISPMDEEVLIEGKNPAVPENEWEVAVPYPLWLQDFLEDDENFALMLPECDDKVGEVLQRIYEWCLAHPPYDLLVKD